MNYCNSIKQLILTQQKKYDKINDKLNLTKKNMFKLLTTFTTKQFSKLTVWLMLFSVAMFGTALITGTVTTLRDMDANLGILKRQKAPGFDLVDKKVVDQILGKKQIKVKAVSGEDIGNTVVEGATDFVGDQISSFISSLIPNCISAWGFSSCHNLTDDELKKATEAANNKTIAPNTAKALNTTLSGHFNNIVGSITRKVTGKLMGALTKDIMLLLKDTFAVFDKYVKILEGLADSYSGTRIAIGYLIYRDLEGENGKGSGNFLSSDQFTKSMLTSSGTNSNFPDKPYLLRVVTDGVAWLDFMNVQRFSQYDIIGGAYKGGLIDSKTAGTATQITNTIGQFTEQNFFTQMENSIDKALLGANCQNSNGIFNTPIFGAFASSGLGNPCQFENANSVKQALKIRQAQIQAFTNSKINQYQLVAPADCKARGYFNVVYPDKEDPANPGHKLTKESYDVEYKQNNPGVLGRALATSARQIERIDISASECETFKTIQQRKAEYATNQTGNINNQLNTGNEYKTSITNKILGAVVGGLKIPQVDLKKDQAGQAADKDIFQQFINTSVSTFNDFAKPLFLQFDLRFKTLLEAGEKVTNGAGAGDKLKKSIEFIKNTIGNQVKDNLNNLTENYKKYREQISNIKEDQNNSLSVAGEVLSDIA